MSTNIFDVRGKRALVTGASSGLGVHFATVLGGAGASIVIAARRTSSLEALAGELRSAGIEVATATLDVTDVQATTATLNDIGPFDILVNNAGIVRSAAALDVNEADWDAVIDTNLKGMFVVAQGVARGMREAGKGGSIINVASILGLRQGGAVLPYAVSKAGVIQMTKCLALEIARFGIRANAIAPGYLNTDLNRDFFETEAGHALVRRIPMRRLGETSELDGPLLLLASDASKYMNGATIAVDGGHLVSTL